MLTLQNSPQNSGRLPAKPLNVRVGLTVSRTGLTTAGTANTNLACREGSNNKIIFLRGKSASPYIEADIYDSDAKTLTGATISGVLTADDLADAGRTGTRAARPNFLVYSTEQSKFYLKGCNTGAHRVYPLTLSGTTITIGAAIDITATYAAGKADEVAMTTDGTDLWFIDLSGNNGPRKYDLSASSMGSAQLAPTTTNYYQTTDSKVHYCNVFLGTTTKLYLISSPGLGNYSSIIQEYSIAGNTWTSRSLPAELTTLLVQRALFCWDVQTPDKIIIMPIGYGTVLYNASGTPEQYGPVYQYTPTTGLATYRGCVTPYPAGIGAQASGAVDTLTASSMLLADTGFSTSYFYVLPPALFPTMDSSENNLVFLANGVIHNAGAKWGQKTVYSYSGSGVINRIACYEVTTANNMEALSADASVVLVVDGVDYPVFSTFGARLDADNVNIPFSTSIAIKSTGFTQTVQVNGGLYFLPTIELQGSITS